MTSQHKPSGPDHEGPHYEDDGINFHLSRKEPSHHLLWTAVSFGTVLLIAWIGGKVDFMYLLMLIGLFVILYLGSWYDEDNATRDRSIKLRVSQQGIEVPEKFSGVLAWDDIEGIQSKSYKGTVTLYIHPNEAGATRVPVNQGLRKYLVGKGIDYQIDHLEGDADDVLSAIRRFAPEHVTENL